MQHGYEFPSITESDIKAGQHWMYERPNGTYRELVVNVDGREIIYTVDGKRYSKSPAEMASVLRTSYAYLK